MLRDEEESYVFSTFKSNCSTVLADIGNHPSVRGIQAGAVPAAALMVYVEQDTCFLDVFAKVYAGTLSKCTTKDQMRYTLNDETGAHQILCDIAGQKLSDHQHAEQ
ncbi:hypothetical protein [Pediococcus pentosaceus]|uniref:hypothetical protein n=1 Tax=Pediococcus pentosaceus TaxID=1255 RepID=UPI00223C0902|nr:hypothetical protein [Pediococcus pentosaceus]